MTNRVLTVLVAAIVLVPASCTSGPSGQTRGAIEKRSTSTSAEDAFLDGLLAKMTLEEKTGQLVQVLPEWTGGAKVEGGVGGERREISPGMQGMLRAGQVGAFIGLEGSEATRTYQTFAVTQSRLGIPLLFGLDVIHGYRTIFPVPLAATCSWDLELVEESERIAATEATAAGVNWTFAPMVDIARDPRWGRIVEGAGEDPYLGRAMASARVRGFQGKDLRAKDAMLACVKHFVAYGGAEGGRDYNSVEVSDRTLREVYLPPFHAAAEAGAGSFMSAFNDIGGVPASAHAGMLSATLRDSWGWKGFVVSDWDSVKELRVHGIAGTRADATRAALASGVDMDMASRCYLESVPGLVREGKLDESVVTEAARRVLRAKYRLGLFEQPYLRGDAEREKREILSAEHRAKAREAGGRSIVLLKNDAGMLPLKRGQNGEGGTIAVIGALAEDRASMLGPWVVSGKPADAVTILEGIRAGVGGAGSERVLYAPGYDPEKLVAGSESEVREAVSVANRADVVVVVLGEPASMSAEARSRASIELPPNQRALFAALKQTGKPLVAVMVSGRPMAIPEVDEQAGAVVQAWFLGVEMGNSVSDVLFGDVNPGGKLAVSFPASTGQIPLYYNHRRTGRPEDPNDGYTSKYIDFRSGPLYPFGHGLSYTRFEYRDLNVVPSVNVGGSVSVECRVKNVGERAGVEVVQLYVRDPVASVSQPVKALKGFHRVALAPGEERTVRFEMPTNLLAFYGVDMKRIVEPGTIHVMIGSSSGDIRLRGDCEIVGMTTEVAEEPLLFSSSRVE